MTGPALNPGTPVRVMVGTRLVDGVLEATEFAPRFNRPDGCTYLVDVGSATIRADAGQVQPA